jgi:hypothetical protein
MQQWVVVTIIQVHLRQVVVVTTGFHHQHHQHLQIQSHHRVVVVYLHQCQSLQQQLQHKYQIQ